MRGRLTSLIIVAVSTLTAARTHADVQTSFDDLVADSSYELAYVGPGEAGVFRDALLLVEGEADERGCITFEPSSTGFPSRLIATWRMQLSHDGHGLGFVLLNATSHADPLRADAIAAWEEPNIPDSLGIGFDTHNPPGGSPFDALGNIYDRPQREVSLHVNGVEIANALAPVELAAGGWVSVHVELVFVPGGANVTVRFGDRYVYDDAFVPHLMPFPPRVAFGAHCDSKAASVVLLDDINVRQHGVLDEPPVQPIRIVAYDRELITPHQQRAPSSADFTPVGSEFRGRVIATLKLSEPEGGVDAWDRGGSLSIFDEQHERYEVFRFVTPFGRGGVWHEDVTHLLPLFRGERPMDLRIDTWEKGWEASVEFSFYPGEMPLIPFKVINLWQGEPEIGNGAEPVSFFYNQRNMDIDPRMDAAFLHTTVTGHGMNPNSKNAAEFMPIERTITVRDTSFTDTLWTTDNYLNPVRPQGGTWKYDRAGWGPGTIVKPWKLDVSRFLVRGERAAISYELAPYQNLNRGHTNPPIHWTESQLILYELPEPNPIEYVCKRASSPIRIDGSIGEAAWEQANWMLLHTDIRGESHQAPRHATAVQLLWDDDNLYIAAQLREPHVNAELVDRDAIVYFDNDFEFFVDPGRDGLNYFEVEINALNTVFDLLIRQPYLDGGDGDIAWDWAGLKTAVSVAGTINNPTNVDSEWMIEMALPFAALREHAGVNLPPGPGDRWGMNVSRVQWVYDIAKGRYIKHEARPEDNWVWAPIGTVNIHHPDHWGMLIFE